MGLIFSKIFSALFGQKDLRILILGLDNAGKTTILCQLFFKLKSKIIQLDKLHFNEVIQTIPTIGFNVETVIYKNLKFQVWDLGGQAGIRSYWRSYYPCTNAVIFVIDSNDRDRLSTTKQELKLILEEEELKNVPILILANKQDLVNVMTETEITEYLELSVMKTRPWAIFKCSAKTGYGLNDGMEWLVSSLKS